MVRVSGSGDRPAVWAGFVQAMGDDYLLRMEGISKAFPGVKALDDVHLEVRPGTVHALMGENGAGKSTLMKVLIGMYQPDAGTIELGGEQVQVADTARALGLGISMIHQELSPVPEMTVAENIYLGREPVNRLRLVDYRKMLADTRALFEKWEIDLDPRRQLKKLSVAQTQMVEIAKAISYDSRLVIMDEPTSAITEREVEHLHRMIRSLRASGVAIIYITHKMDEVFRISDYVTVFRDGRHVATLPASELDRGKLVALMVGRELTHLFPKEHVDIGDVLISVQGLTRADGAVRDISFDIHRGEIVGLAGLMGAGRTEVLEAIFGVAKISEGTITIDGKRVRDPRPGRRHRGRARPAHRGSQAIRDHGRALGARQHVGREPRPVQQLAACSGEAPIRADVQAQREALSIKTPTLAAADQAPVGRQSAEGPRLALAADDTRHPDDRRADPRHRRRGQGRDPPADVRARAAGQGDPDGQLGAARDPGHERPGAGDARGPAHRRVHARRGHAGEDHARRDRQRGRGLREADR